MGKSFDNRLEAKVEPRDGQSVWFNMKKRLTNSGKQATPAGLEHVKCTCVPYAVMHCGVDMCKDLDDDPLHTSLPDGTYYGVEYQHSDNCLFAKYPDIAAAISPIVEYYLKQTYTVVDQTITTLVIDAVGNMIAVGWKIYGAALSAARIRSGYKTKDEDNMFIGPVILDKQFRELGKLNGQSAILNHAFAGASYDAATQATTVDTLSDQHPESQSTFDKEINSLLVNAFMSNTTKALCQMLFGHVWKGRYIDADSNRYYVFGVDEMSLIDENPTFAHYRDQIKQWSQNHAGVILNRYTFMPNLLASLGLYRLDVVKEPDNPNSAPDRIIINQNGNTIPAIYDESDVIKNIIDHQLITIDEIDADSILGTTYTDMNLLEADSYFNNELEIGDNVLVDDAILSVLMHVGIRGYNCTFVDIGKQGTATTPGIGLTYTYPKTITFNSFAIGVSGADLEQVCIINTFINTSRIIDATWQPHWIKTATSYQIADEEIIGGINTYVAPTDQMYLIDMYAVYGICLSPKEIKKANEILIANPGAGKTAR